MPTNPADRVQAIMGIILFAAVGLGLLLTGFLRVLDWRRNRHVQHDYQDAPMPAPAFSSIDPYDIAEEALKLVEQVRVENERLKRQLARYEAKKPHGGTMPATRWLGIINDEPDLVPHVGIEGASRTGKTTLAEGILHARAGQILIISAKTGDEWGGLPYETVDDDGSFTTAGATFKALHQEVLRRLVAAKHKRDPGPWLTVVLDDYPALRDACPAADEPFLLVARVGASLRVRLIVLTYSLSVKELGLEGKGDARHHVVWIKRTRHGQERTATMQWEGQTYDLETEPVIALARRPLDLARAWQPALAPAGTTSAQSPTQPQRRGVLSRLLPRRSVNATPDADVLLGRLLADHEHDASVVVSTPEGAHNGHNGAIVAPGDEDGIAGIQHPNADTSESAAESALAPNVGADTVAPARDLPNAVISALARGEKWSANRIAQYLYGSKQKRLQRIEEAIQSEQAQPEEAAVTVV